MNTIAISFKETDLASRGLAIQKRLEVETALNRGAIVIMDFAPVKSISGSYADELFGILTKSYGVNKLLQLIKIRACSDYCLQVIAESIDRRAKETNPQAA